MKGPVISLATVGVVTAAGLRVNPHATYELHMQMIKERNIKPLSSGNTTSIVGKSASTGSYMTQVFESVNCKEDTLFTASGYVYGHCISVDGASGYSYDDCSQSNGKTTVQLTTCDSGDCSSGCTTFPLPVDTGCKTMSIFSCESSTEPWNDLGLNSHMEMYWGDDDCGGDFDQWTAVNIDEGDRNDIECYSDSDSMNYAMQAYCDVIDNAPRKDGDDDACADDIGAASQDIAQAGIDIAAAVTDCADGFTAACNNDIDAVLEDLTSAAEHITAAVYDCGGEEPTDCSEDISAILADITAATEAITDAIISCPVSDVKCAADITQAAVAVGKAAADTAKAVNDC